MNTINTFIVEDDLSFLMELKLLLEETKLTLIGTADNAIDAIGKIIHFEPDLILMDIDLKGELRGTEVAEKLEHLRIPIIFITSFPQTSDYEKALKKKHFAFLSKPIEKFTLLSTIDLLFAHKEKDNYNEDEQFLVKEESLYLKKKEAYHRIYLSEINYIVAEGNYCKIYTNNNTFIHRITISALEKILPADFVRTHRSHIVNLNKVDSFSLTEQIVKLEGQVIPMSQNAKSYFEDIIKEKGLNSLKKE